MLILATWLGVGLFNEAFYLRTNPDVAAAVAQGLLTAREHFDLYGKYESRSPSPFFDQILYLRANPDVADAVSSGLINAVEHFMSFGQYEGRSASFFFDPAVYTAVNSDVSEALKSGAFKSAFEHFVLHGQFEVRNTAPFFDLKGYLDANPDVADAVRSGHTTAFDHFINYGHAEGRNLGNGISLAQFASDLKAQAAIRSGDFNDLMGRVAEVAPFLATFVGPQGYSTPRDTPLPADFIPVGDEKLVVPPGVDAPAVLPPNFEQPAPEPQPEPNPGGGGGGGTPPPPVDPLVVAFNAVTNPADFIQLIRAHDVALDVAGNFAQLPMSGGRIDAVGAGVKEVRDLFGSFETVAQIKTAVEKHIQTELNKQAALQSLYTTTDVDTFISLVGALARDRADIISYYKSLAASAAGLERVDALEEELYTVALAGLATALDTDKKGSIFDAFMEVRGEYNGSIVTLVKKLYEAQAKVDGDVAFMRSVNLADGESAVLYAIKKNKDFENLLGEDAFPDGGGREKAVAVGVIDTIGRLGAFSDIEDLNLVVSQHIAMETNKANFIAGAQVQQDTDFAGVFEGLIRALANDRAGIINFWAESGDVAGQWRADQLLGDTYTVVLNQIVGYADSPQVGAPKYWEELAASFNHINSEYTGSVVTLIGQLQTAHQAVLDGV